MDPGLKRILLVAPNWVGDTVFMLPACAALRRAHPGAEITLLAKPSLLALHKASPYFNRFEALDASGRGARLGSYLRLRPRRFDLGLLFPPSFSSALGLFLTGTRLRVGRRGEGRAILLNRSLPKARREIHVSEEYLELARLAGAEPMDEDRRPRFPLTQEGAEEQNRLFREHGLLPGPQCVALCPSTAFGPSKRWGSRKYGELARWLKAERFQPFLLGAPHESGELREVSELAGGLPQLMPSLPGLAACLAAAGLVIGNDSGPLHLAAASGTRVLGLYGPIDPRWSAPLGLRAEVVYSAEPCSPCHQKTCPLGHHHCMEHITVERVSQGVRELLKR